MGRRFLHRAAPRRPPHPEGAPAGGWKWRRAPTTVAAVIGLWAALASAGLPSKGDRAGIVPLDRITGSPARYKAELDPADLELSKFQSGPLTGWYVYVYVKHQRVVCANPMVWDGPKVVTCTHIVAIEQATRPGESAPPGGPPVGEERRSHRRDPKSDGGER